jgi:hypothetical protein
MVWSVTQCAFEAPRYTGPQRMTYTLTEASKATGKSKSTLLRAIQSSKISATKDEVSGDWRVEPAEVHRLYPAIMHDAPNGAETTHHGMASLIKELRTQLEASAQRIADKDDTISDLRRRLDAEGEERRKLTAILTDQRMKAPDVMVTPLSSAAAIITQPPAADPAPAATPTPAPPARPNAAPAVVKVRPAKKPPKADVSWWRKMVGGR